MLLLPVFELLHRNRAIKALQAAGVDLHAAGIDVAMPTSSVMDLEGTPRPKVGHAPLVADGDHKFLRKFLGWFDGLHEELRLGSAVTLFPGARADCHMSAHPIGPQIVQPAEPPPISKE